MTARTLVYQYDQVGGNYHHALVLVRNSSRKLAVGVGGQLSVYDAAGNFVKSDSPPSANILPRRQALLESLLDLPRPLPNGRLRVKLRLDRYRKAPKRSPVRLLGTPTYTRDAEDGRCKVSGVFTNRFKRESDGVNFRAAAFAGGRLVGGGISYGDRVFPRTPASFDIDFISPAECPQTPDRIRVYPNLEERQLYGR